jgi:hypothetical protein
MIMIIMLLLIIRVKMKFIFCYPVTFSCVFTEQYMVFVFSKSESRQPYCIINNIIMFQAVPFHV